MTPSWRFIDSGPLPGSENMRLDEAHAIAMSRGEIGPLVRLFRWNPWAVSLGYNQQANDIDRARAVADGIDVVRRPTGGRAILHADELTYSVVMDAGRKGVLQVYNEISEALVAGLRLYGVEVSLQKSQPNFAEHYRQASSVPCFTASARYEIEWRGRKLVGSAQRRFSGEKQEVVLQHGSLLCGPAHKRLADYLSAGDPELVARVRNDMQEKTVDLAEVSGEPVDMGRLSACIRKGFEQTWGIVFQAAGEPAADRPVCSRPAALTGATHEIEGGRQ
jgi:lipoyl(octanoyl) transferase